MGTLANRKLLVADDSPAVQKVVALTFGDEGYQVTAVGDGRHALDELARDVPDVVLADVTMPETNGYQLCERIKRDERLRHVPVILLVSAFEPFNEAEARRVGADDVLTKPFQSIREMVNKVGNLLGGKRETASDEQAMTSIAPPAEHARAAPPSVDAPPGTSLEPTVAADADFGEDDRNIEVIPLEGRASDEHAHDENASDEVVDDNAMMMSRDDERAAASPIEETPIEEATHTDLPVTDDNMNEGFAVDADTEVMTSDDLLTRLPTMNHTPNARDAAAPETNGETLLELDDLLPAPAFDAQPAFAENESVEDGLLDLPDEPSAAAAPHNVASSHGGQITLDQLAPEVIEAIARRVVEQLSERAVQEIAWEVVPALAERIIKRRLETDEPGL